MDKQILEKVKIQVYRRHPEFNGCKPTVRRQGTSKTKSNPATKTYLLTFKTKVPINSSSGPRELPRNLRVVVDGQGKIIKTSTSR